MLPHDRVTHTNTQVEIGADGLAANAGGEPAIRHTRGGPLVYNGTNFFLMREAVKRNPNITLYGDVITDHPCHALLQHDQYGLHVKALTRSAETALP